MLWLAFTILIIIIAGNLSDKGLRERTYSTPASFILARGWVISVDLQTNTEVIVTADADDYFRLRLGQETKWPNPLPTLLEKQSFHMEETLPTELGQIQDWKVVGSKSNAGAISFQIKEKESPAKIRVYPTQGEKTSNRILSGWLAFCVWFIMTLLIFLV